ncbi:sugar transferase [Weissella confusa]|uniref:sugar transferase n=1 Tax=Weissella confusa TaxID=1583 RepID=UPI002A752068|nr:sugar transferase [Weissella confusa]MDY2522493.1 sugar transferase [Weissella confusa]
MLAMVMDTVMDTVMDMVEKHSTLEGIVNVIYNGGVKRILDITFALILLIVFLIPGVIIALIVKFTSPGPVFFRQLRYGKNSEQFTILKFRTMSNEAPVLSNQEFTDIESFVTPIGNILRKSSLDEIPQVINILKGDMSFIGPRPLADTDWTVIQLRKKNGSDKIRPGITGWAQVNGRNNITDKEKAAYDYEYYKLMSPNIDFDIVLRTIKNIIQSKDIYKNNY